MNILVFLGICVIDATQQTMNKNFEIKLLTLFSISVSWFRLIGSLVTMSKL